MRYDRQLPVFGEDGQEMIEKATVGIAGCGGLGNSAATHLADAGVRRFVICDPDTSEESNLNRQFVYAWRSGRKADVLAEWIRVQNPDAVVDAHAERFRPETESMFDGCDVLVDCLDSMESRMDLNSYAVRTGKPLVHGAADGMRGQVAVCVPGGPCLRCMLGDVRVEASASVGAAVAAVGALEASEALKLIVGKGGPAFLHADLDSLEFTPVRFGRDPGCPVCSSAIGGSRRRTTSSRRSWGSLS